MYIPVPRLSNDLTSTAIVNIFLESGDGLSYHGWPHLLLDTVGKGHDRTVCFRQRPVLGFVIPIELASGRAGTR